MERPFSLITNYIYFYHLNKFVLLPVYPDTINDSSSISFQSSTPLSRSAPIQSFSSAGPRTVQLSFDLHRDLMRITNYNVSNVDLPLTDDYIDYLVNQLQAMALPRYSASQKMVDPPMVAIRLGNQIYCKGVVSSGVSTTYRPPILPDGKYAQVSVAFTVTEVDPYDAEYVWDNGSFRGLNTSLERRLFVQSNSNAPTKGDESVQAIWV